MGTPDSAIYEFDDFRVDAVERVLLRSGASVPLTPRGFEHPALLRAAPRKGAGEGRAHANDLAGCGCGGEQPEPERLHAAARAGHEPLHRDGTGAGLPLRRRRKKSGGARGGTTAAPGKAIAVLPFLNMSADLENEYFCDGLAEELLNALTKIEGLKVVARTSAFSFKGKNASVSDIREALGVGTILEGSVRRSGIHLRITVQLINAETGYHLWSERYDRRMEDIFDVQDAITLAVVNTLKVRLLGGEKAAVLKHHTGNPEAYQLYLKGRYYWYKTSPEEFRKSRDYYERAIHLDPAYALAYSGLADYYGFATATGVMPPNDWWPKAEEAAMKAVESDETLAEVHNPLAALKLFYYRDWTGAEREFKRAFELNPQFGEIHHLLSFYLAAMGRFDESITACRRALELDPLSLRINLTLGWMFYLARRFEEAARQYREALELDPNNASVHESLGDVYEQEGKTDEAVAQWRTAMTLAGDDELAVILGHLREEGFSGAAAGSGAEAARTFERETQKWRVRTNDRLFACLCET